MAELLTSVPSYKLCIRAKAAGYPQDTYFVYRFLPEQEEPILVIRTKQLVQKCAKEGCELVAAPTFDELYQWVPKTRSIVRPKRFSCQGTGYLIFSGTPSKFGVGYRVTDFDDWDTYFYSIDKRPVEAFMKFAIKIASKAKKKSQK